MAFDRRTAESGRAAQQLRGVLDAVAAVASDLSLDGLLERILRQAGGLVGAEAGFLHVLDPRSDRRIGSFAAYGIPGVDDLKHPGAQFVDDLVDRTDGTAVIEVPIRIHDVEFGRMYLIGESAGSGFSRDDEQLAVALASAAGVVIENARLYEEGERQRLWLEAGAEITATLLAPMSRPAAYQMVADRARDVAAADFVAMLMPAGEDALMVESVSGLPAEGVLGELVDVTHSVAGDAARHSVTIVVPDTELEPRYEPHKTRSWPDLGSLMVLPLRGHEGTGALIVGWLKGHQTDRWSLDAILPQRFADQAALVLQVARAQEDQARLAVFEDRDRIGRDLHDLVIQRLFGIGLMLENTTKLLSSPSAVERVASAIDDIDETIKDIRRTIFALSPSPGTDDLRTQVETAVRHAGRLLGFQPQVRLVGPIDTAVSDMVREHLMAVIGELLSNVVRHAEATHVLLELDVSDGVDLRVSDDGRGVGTGEDGTGLRNIRQRAQLLRGSCVIESRPGGGMSVGWHVPAGAA